MSKKLITAGVDEVGRGCLAGPVVSAAVVLKKGINLKDELEYDIGQGLLELYDYIKNENQNE